MLASFKWSLSPKNINAKDYITTIKIYILSTALPPSRFSPPKCHFKFYAFSYFSPLSLALIGLFVCFFGWLVAWFLLCGVRKLHLQGSFLFVPRDCWGWRIICIGTIVNMQCLLFCISNTNGKTYDNNLLGLSALNILENKMENNCVSSL